jgi:hypothetical protein
MKDRAETIVAGINGLLVVLGPPVLLGITGMLVTDTAVHPADYSRVAGLLAVMTSMAIGLSPFGMLAAWRTFVYARRRRDRHDSSWLGVFESGACGFAMALMVLAGGIVTRPREALPYVLVYGGGALVIGLVVGLVLRTTALIALHFCRAGEHV